MFWLSLCSAVLYMAARDDWTRTDNSKDVNKTLTQSIFSRTIYVGALLLARGGLFFFLAILINPCFGVIMKTALIHTALSTIAEQCSYSPGLLCFSQPHQWGDWGCTASAADPSYPEGYPILHDMLSKENWWESRATSALGPARH